MSTHSLYRHCCLSCVVFSLLLFFIDRPDASWAIEPDSTDNEAETLSYLKSLSIEELLQTRITSVSKKSEHLFSAAAAITVITQEDIKRAGANSIPEALRLVPGLQVAQIDSSRYAISARGFNDFFANKLLVLIDGRSTYAPLFSGVYWNAQDTLMEDIDRIEVIRGPGATVWGANAVNGVINIITKNSAETQGTLVSTVVGNKIQPMISTRYGGRIDESTTYRLFAKGFERAGFDNPGGAEAHDAWDSLRAGFRLDREQTGSDAASVQAEMYQGSADAVLGIYDFTTQPISSVVQGTEDFEGGHVLTNWRHRFSAASDITFQMYYDHTLRDQIVVKEARNTIDLELKNHWNPAGVHDIVWGAGYRWTKDRIDDTTYISFDPDNRSDNLWSTFIQDDINIIDDTAWLTLGSKFEHNDYSGFEIQPSVRFRIQPTPQQIIWTAVSRAVRTPSRSERDVESNIIKKMDSTNDFVTARLRGNPAFDSEELIAYELGYRRQISKVVSMDLATYYNDYDKLRGTRAYQPFFDPASSPPLPVIPYVFENNIEGSAYGFELQGTWQAAKNLRFIAAYSWIKLDLHYKDPDRSDDKIVEMYLTPHHQFQLRSSLDLTKDLFFDTELYYVSGLNSSEIGSYIRPGLRDIDSYVRLDLQLGWQALGNLKIYFGIKNLLDPGHKEFPDSSQIIASDIPRQYWIKATCTF